MARNKTTKISGRPAGASPQTAIAHPAAGRPQRLAFSPIVGDALSFGRQKHIPTPDEARKMFGPALTLGAPKEAQLAMDSALEAAGFYSLLQHGLDMGVYGGMANFLGYAALQNIAQNGLIRACIETVSDDMTRNWIEFTREGEKDDQDKNGTDDKLDKINKEFDKLELQKVLHEACSMTGYYGGCLLYLDTGANGEYLKHPLNLDPMFSMEARNAGFLKAVRCIDPINVFPGTYNATDPLAADYYRPSMWWVLGKQVHASRLIRVVANEAPLIYKPSYNFLGIPQAQILWDYVLHFQQNRDAANRLLNKFSMLVFKTAMADILEGQNSLDQLDTRMQILARNQSNDGVFAIDREAEDVVKVETPLGGVTDIVKQSLEQLAAMNRTPAVKLLGISPSGFNATGESDIRNYYDHILSQQEKVLRHAIKDILDVVQISIFGEVDETIGFNFCPLSEDDKNATAMTQQVKANTLCALLDRDVISPEEARRALISDPSSGLNDLDPDEVPEPKEGEGMPGMPEMEGMGGEEQTPEGQAAEEDDEVSLGRQLLGMDAAPEDDIQWRSLKNGQPFPIHEGETIKEAAENFIASKEQEKENKPASRSPAPAKAPAPGPAPASAPVSTMFQGSGSAQASGTSATGNSDTELPTVSGRDGNPISYSRTANGTEYVDKLQSAKQSIREDSKRKNELDKSWRVDVHDAEDYDKSANLYHTQGGSVIAVVHTTDDDHTKGDIISVCGFVGAERGSDLLKLAVANGGDRLDSFDGNHGFYIRNGFEPVSWVKFDDEYAPEEWKALNPGFKPGMKDSQLKVPREDVIFYRYTGRKTTESAEDFKKRVAASNSYDEAKKVRNDMMDKGE